MMEKNISVGLVSLGCPRNLVDSEVILGILRKNGFRISNRIDRCDAAVINTCSFVEDARKESVDLIMRAIDLKKEGRVRKIIVCGCLPQRYPEELKKELGEVDAFLGVSDFPKISRILRDCLEDKRPAEIDPQPDFLYDHTSPRMRITPKHYAYVKLTEGCGNRCSYCVIPSVRGELRSRAMGSVVDEVRMLSRGKKLSEINLVGQDITSYGMDRYKKPMLADLLKKVSALKRPRWLRLLYTHPAHYTDELIEVIQSEKGICRYLDLPLQHINDKVLKAMNRGVTKKEIMTLIRRLRKKIPGLALRTTFIVGFPGETAAEFGELLAFVKEMEFDRLGVFEYSKEEGTPAYAFRSQVPDRAKKERLDELMLLQQEIAKKVNARFMGRTIDVLVDEVKDQPIGRSEYDAPEVDGTVFLKFKKKHKPGDFIKAKIIDTLEYDLVGEEQ